MGIRVASLFLLCIVSVVCAVTVFPALLAGPPRDGTNGGTDAGNFVNLKAEILGTNYRKIVEENADVVALRQAVEGVFSAADGGLSGGMDNGSVPGLPPLMKVLRVRFGSRFLKGVAHKPYTFFSKTCCATSVRGKKFF